MIRRPPRATRTDTLFPYTTLFRSSLYGGIERQQVGLLRDLSYVARGLADQIHRMEQQLHLLARAPGLVDRQIDDALARLGLRPDFRDRFDKAAAAERDGADVFRHLHRAAGRIGDKADRKSTRLNSSH